MFCGGVCSCNDDTAICAGLIDPSNPNWREAVRSEWLNDDLDVEFVSEDTQLTTTTTRN